MSRPPTVSEPPGPRPGSRARPLAGLVFGAALAVGAGTLLAHHDPASRAFVVASVGRIPAPGLGQPAPAADRPAVSTQPLNVPPQGGSPTRLAIATVALDAPVVPVQVDNAALGVPDNVHTLGWWSGGRTPGDPHGTVVIDGHVDSARQGLGALAAVSRLTLGAAIEVTTTREILTYQVQAIRAYNKNTLPADVFNPQGPPRLVLITCGGPFEATTGHYRDNIVIYATRSQTPAL